MRLDLFCRASGPAIVLALALAAGSAAAQSTTQAPAQADEPFVDTVTVTAQFREQNVLEVPLAVTAYDGAFLDQIGVDGFEKLSSFTPGFVVQEQSVNNPGFVLRGITSDSGASNIEPRVSVFQNGVSISRSRGSNVPLFDLERVEVLKGPQGTLFGRSAQIGAVHLITAKPTYDFGASLSAETGNFDLQSYRGFINIPLIEDKAAIRLAGSYKRRSGFIDNPTERDLNGTDTLALRGSLRFEPTQTLTFDLIGNYVKDEPPGTSFKSGVIPAFGGNTNPNDFATLNTFGNFLNGSPLGVDRRLFDVTGIARWDISDAVSVVSTTAYRDFDSVETFDPDGTAFDVLIFAEDATGEQISSDIRFSYDNGGRFKGFFGGGYFKEEGTQSVPLGLNVGNVAALFGSLAAVGAPSNGVAFFGGSGFLANAFLSGNPAVLRQSLTLAGIPNDVFQVETFANSADNTSFDVFADVSYDLTDRLTVTAGGRWTRDDKETIFDAAITSPNPITPFIIGAPGVLVGNSGGPISSDNSGVDDSFSGFSWRGIVNYEVADNKYVYFNYSRGRRPEVLQDDFDATATGGVAGGFSVIPAETVNSYEAGAKGEFFDRALTLELAGYYYGYQNFQTSVVANAGSGSAPVFRVVNAGTATSYGVELGARARPAAGFDVFFTYGWNRGRFDDVDENGDPQQFAGNQFRLSPDHSLSFGFNYVGETSFGEVFFTPTYTWKSRVFFEDENTEAFDVVNPLTGATVFSVPAVAQDAFGLLNMRAGVRFDDGRYELRAFAENLLGKEFIIDAGNTGGAFGVPTFIAGAPRFYGAGFSITF